MQNILFVVGTGRCGTHFTYQLFSASKSVASSHERYPLQEAFTRYVKWYDIPIDHSGFLEIMKTGIQHDLEENLFSIESSAYLSLSIQELSEKFDAKFLLMVRSPRKVIESYSRKGWYEFDFVQSDPGKILGLQAGERDHHTFSRIAPKGEYFLTWNKMSRFGKLAWFWQALNSRVLEEAANLCDGSFRIQRLEDLDFSNYCEICDWIGLEDRMKERDFNKIRTMKPGKVQGTDIVWTQDDKEIVHELTYDLATKLSY